MNIGKIFEKNFKDSVNKSKDGQVFIHRLKDRDTSYRPTETSKYTPKNECDFYLFYNGIFYALELKCTTYGSVGFELEDENSKKMIKPHQIKDLTKLTKYKGIVPGFVFNFKNEQKDIEEVYFLHINDFNKFVNNTDKKSINKSDVVVYGGIPIEANKKRVYFSYGINKMIDDIEKYIKKGDESIEF